MVTIEGSGIQRLPLEEAKARLSPESFGVVCANDHWDAFSRVHQVCRLEDAEQVLGRHTWEAAGSYERPHFYFVEKTVTREELESVRSALIIDYENMRRRMEYWR